MSSSKNSILAENQGNSYFRCSINLDEESSERILVAHQSTGLPKSALVRLAVLNYNFSQMKGYRTKNSTKDQYERYFRYSIVLGTEASKKILAAQKLTGLPKSALVRLAVLNYDFEQLKQGWNGGRAA